MTAEFEAIALDAGFVINGVQVLPLERVVVRDDRRFKLEPKVMAILLELARRPGEVISREDFATTVWRGRVVSDEVLSRNISILRSALGDDARSPRFIQTIPTVGYRLLIEPAVTEAGGGQRRRLPLIVAAAGTCLVALVAILFVLADFENATLPATTIAVLPFENLSDGDDAVYFSDGLADEVLDSLTRSEHLNVVARTSSFVFRGRQQDAREIGRILGAGSLLEGSVRKQGERLRISARLVSTNDGLQLWTQSFDTRLRDVFKVQDEISNAIVEKLVGTLAPSVPPAIDPLPDLDAYQLFLRASYQLNRRGTDAMERAVDLFSQAVALDPEFARAYVGLARAQSLIPTYFDEPELPYLEDASQALAVAESLGSQSPRLLATRAYILFRQWQWIQAHDHFERALDRSPNDSDTRQQFSQFLGTVGRIPDALTQAKLAVQSDPLSGVAHQRLGVVYLWVDDLDLASRHLEMANELGLGELATPEASIALLVRERRLDEAEERLLALQAQRGLPGDWVAQVIRALRDPSGVGDALRTLKTAYEQRWIGPRLYLGALYFIGDETGFYDGLDALIDEHAAIDLEILFTPIAGDLRSSPRFEVAMQRLDVPRYWSLHGRP